MGLYRFKQVLTIILVMMSYFGAAINKNYNKNDTFELALLNFNANDYVNAPTYHQFLNVRNMKNTFEEKYYS